MSKILFHKTNNMFNVSKQNAEPHFRSPLLWTHSFIILGVLVGYCLYYYTVGCKCSSLHHSNVGLIVYEGTRERTISDDATIFHKGDFKQVYCQPCKTDLLR